MECVIEQTKRTRVRGSGPKRKELKPFAKLHTLDTDLINEILKLSEIQQNDLGTDKYEISKHCNFETVFNANKKYRQVLLQTKKSNDASSVDEFAYTEWDESVPKSLQAELTSLFGDVFRFRISVMEGDHSLNWHIDTDTSVICRAQICLNANQSSFDFSVKGEESSYSANPGDVHFVNTGWSHRVVNGSNQRIVAIFGFRFDAASEKVQKMLYV